MKNLNYDNYTINFSQKCGIIRRFKWMRPTGRLAHDRILIASSLRFPPNRMNNDVKEMKVVRIVICRQKEYTENNFINDL